MIAHEVIGKTAEAAQCRGKHRFPNPAQAMRMIRRRRASTEHAYRCPHCGGWHVGHVPRTKNHKRKGYW